MSDTAPLPESPDKRRKGSGGRRPAPTPSQIVANARHAVQIMSAKGIRPVKVGRPRSYTPECCAIAVDIGARGGSIAAIAAAMGVARSVIIQWEAEFEEFKTALARARDAAQHWWEHHGQRNLKADRYQAQIWSKTMAARFQEYRDAEKGSQPNGLDLSELVGAISQGITAATLQHQDGDRAKVIDAQPVEDDAPARALQVELRKR